ncbi:hypothetical protein K503DRAFT_771919 [Rhizopogon vinicolor AM-OR11-026]|uniref:Uncharacterized protein n=1 Tax=Rhizopogon vinicolor AM-OR11-026 TaxID=1314800 RepID=A0A1B7MWM6_9AGAM|nr:hypothetical protein K503DRAFT_771919 [Rhizopogon vinicolor AM-OR11-026]
MTLSRVVWSILVPLYSRVTSVVAVIYSGLHGWLRRVWDSRPSVPARSRCGIVT